MMENNNAVTICSLLTAALTMTGMVLLSGSPLCYLLIIILYLAGCIAVNRLTDDLSGMYMLTVILFGTYGIPFVLAVSGFLNFGMDIFQTAFAVIMALIIPAVYSGIIAIHSHDVERCGFSGYFNSIQVIAFIGYVFFMVFWIVFCDRTEQPVRDLQPVPFATFAAYIEALIVKSIPAGIFLFYLLYTAIIFVPFGFFVQMYMGDFRFITRIAVVFAVPLLVEIIRFAFAIKIADVDDFILGFAGGAAGMLLFTLSDNLFMKSCGRGITGRVRRYSFE